MENHYPFSLEELPYAYDALQPYISEEILHFHHDKHLKTYVDNLNKALEPHQRLHSWSLERLLKNFAMLPTGVQTAIRNNGGGVYNHNLYFRTMAPAGTTQPGEMIQNAIIRDFSSVEKMEEQLTEAAAGVFGSGWAWLVSDHRGQLRILTTANQDTPLPQNFCSLLLVDVWEHAYYLEYQNRRAEYLQNWRKLINWDVVEQNYLSCIRHKNLVSPYRKV